MNVWSELTLICHDAIGTLWYNAIRYDPIRYDTARYDTLLSHAISRGLISWGLATLFTRVLKLGSCPRWRVQKSVGTEAEGRNSRTIVILKFCNSLKCFWTLFSERCNVLAAWSLRPQVSHHIQCTRTWRGHVPPPARIQQFWSTLRSKWYVQYNSALGVATSWPGRYQQIFPVWTIAAGCQDACSQRWRWNQANCKIKIKTKVTKNQRQLATATSDNRINLWPESQCRSVRCSHLMTFLDCADITHFALQAVWQHKSEGEQQLGLQNEVFGNSSIIGAADWACWHCLAPTSLAGC